MASITNVSRDDVRLARKGGFRRKAPKKPKLSSSNHVLERWIARYNDWAKEVKKAATKGKDRQKLQDSVRSATR